jgi:hypothetical protein
LQRRFLAHLIGEVPGALSGHRPSAQHKTVTPTRADTATKAEEPSEYRKHLEHIASNDPDPAMRARADAVLEKLDAGARP